MGGIGSGRPADLGRDTVESCRAIDVNRLHQEGCLHHGWWGGWQCGPCFDICTSCDQNPIAGRLHFRQQGPQ